MKDKPIDLRHLKIMSKPANKEYEESYDRIFKQSGPCPCHKCYDKDECYQDCIAYIEWENTL
jgi:hypothetical protein